MNLDRNPNPKRDYSARVKLIFAGAKKPRYLRSTRDAVRLYRDINLRLMQAGQPSRPATLEPVRGWEGALSPTNLTVTSSGGVVVHRAATRDDFRSVPAPIWPSAGVQA